MSSRAASGSLCPISMNGGNDPLAERELLRDALKTLAACGRELGVAAEETVAWGAAAASLGDPLLVLLVGEEGAGKTALAGALAGSELGSDGLEEPATGTLLTVWRHGFDPVDAVDRDVLERYRPVASLRGCEFVEVGPAASAAGADAAARAYAMADLVLLVFPVSDPWSKAGWEFLRGVHRRRRRAVAAVLTHADERGREETDAIVEYLGNTGEAALAEGVPVFAVSSTGALAATDAGASEMFDLKCWIADAAGSRPGAAEKRGQAERVLQRAAEAVGRVLSQSVGDSDAEAECVGWIGEEIERDHAASMAAAAVVAAAACAIYQEDAAGLRQRLARVLGPVGIPGSLVVSGRWMAAGLDRAAERAAAGAEDGARRALAAEQNRVGSLRRRVDERALAVFGEGVAGDLAAAGEDIAIGEGADQLARRADARVREAAGDREAGPAVGSMLGGRRLLLWGFALVLATVGTGLGFALGQGNRLLMALSGGFLLVIVLWAGVYLRARHRGVLAYFDDEVAASHEQITRDLTRVYSAEFDAAYQGYASRLGRLRTRAADQAAARTDLLERSAAAIKYAAGREANSEL